MYRRTPSVRRRCWSPEACKEAKEDLRSFEDEVQSSFINQAFAASPPLAPLSVPESSSPVFVAVPEYIAPPIGFAAPPPPMFTDCRYDAAGTHCTSH